MNTLKIVALGLIIAGVLGLAYGSFTYTSDTHKAGVGPVQFSVAEKETVNVPIWFGAGLVILGTLILIAPKIRR